MIFNKQTRLVLLTGVLCATANASTIFNFDADSLGTSTNFTDTVNGLSATFSSAADPGGFVVYASMFQTLTGNVLGDPGPAGLDNLALDVNFNHDLSAVTLNFATADFSNPSPLTISAYENGAQVGSASSSGAFLSGFSFPEGEISFVGGAFNQLVISSAAADFAVDNISVNASTPEPEAGFLIGAGLVMLGLPAIRRKSARGSGAPVFKTAAVALLSLTATVAPAQSTRSIFPLLPPTVSTVPSNGDVNPYGVAFVPKTSPANGILQPGDILVSNFNNSANLQGTGTTILRVDKTGATSTFFTSPTNQGGLSAALGVLSNGFVLIGNLPTADGSAATVQPGRLALLDRRGNFIGTFGTLATIDGPWGMAVHDTGNGTTGTANVFVSNILSGVVSRFDISYNSASVSASVTIIANGFSHRVDPAALVLGPSGLAYDAVHDTLYVASSTDDAVYEITTAAATHATLSATLLFQDFVHLHGPLDLAILPNGHLLIANSDGSNADPAQPSELVEYSAAGQFLGQMSLDLNNGGAFGLAASNIAWGTFRLAAVDDNANSLKIWTAVAQ